MAGISSGHGLTRIGCEGIRSECAMCIRRESDEARAQYSGLVISNEMWPPPDIELRQRAAAR